MPLTHDELNQRVRDTRYAVRGPIVIRAQAKLLSQSFDCIGPLEKSTFFVNVKQRYATMRQINDRVLIDFELVADIEKTVARSKGGRHVETN